LHCQNITIFVYKFSFFAYTKAGGIAMFLDVICYCIIPISTIWFSYHSNWFTSNFSVISQLPNRQIFFLLWAALINFCFYFLIKRILNVVPNHRQEKNLLIVIMIFLFLTTQLPYQPLTLPFQSLLHVCFAWITAALFTFCLYRIIFKLYYRKKDLYRSYAIALTVITCICILLFFMTGIVSSALEIFFVLSCTFLLKSLYKTVSTHDRRNYSRYNLL
jgi:hypothetical protein